MIWLFALVACAPAPEEKVPEEQEPPIEIDWGSWEIHTTFVQQDEICLDPLQVEKDLESMFHCVTSGARRGMEQSVTRELGCRPA